MASTEVASGFRWVEGPAGRALVSDALTPYAPHAFTTRDLKFRDGSAVGDLQRVAQALSVEAERVVRVSQVHGRAVITVAPDVAVPPSTLADAVLSVDPSRAILIFVADCVPVLLADRQGRVVAAIHAGWRGTSERVSAATVDAIRAIGVAPSDLVAVIGPSVGPCCYQVDRPVREAFLAVDPGAARWFVEDGPTRWRLDLWRANAEQLVDAGLSAEAVQAARYCTIDHPRDCYSYRREGVGAGRMAAAIRLDARAPRPQTVFG